MGQSGVHHLSECGGRRPNEATTLAATFSAPMFVGGLVQGAGPESLVCKGKGVGGYRVKL